MKIELKKSNKIVIKIGSSIINNDDGKDYLSNICDEISKFVNEGKEIIIVTSGAISQGMSILSIRQTKRYQKAASSSCNWTTKANVMLRKNIFTKQ